MALTDLLERARGLLGRGRPSGTYAAQLTPEKQEFIRSCADLGARRVRNYGLYEDYYDGEQRTRLLERARRYLEASGVKWSENFCETVVDSHANRMEVTGFKVENDDAEDGISDWLTRRLLGRRGMLELQGIVHTNTYIKGDGCLILTPDPVTGMPKAAWNRPETMKFVYDEETDALLYAVKKWSTSKRSQANPDGDLVWRLNVYFPDRVEKWFSPDSEGEHWAPWWDENDIVDTEQYDENGQVLLGEDLQPVMAPAPVWPIPWTMDGTPGGEPIGVCAIHFRRKPKGRNYGRSIVRKAMTSQDALNKTLLDLFYVSDMQAWAQRWATGVSDTDRLKVAVGEYLAFTSEGAKVGQLDPSDPQGVLAICADILARLSAKTYTPLHDLIITGTPPSGEALKTAESGLTHDLEDDQVTFGSPWGECAWIGWRIAKAYGTEQVPEWMPGAEVEVVWESVETRDEQAEATTLGLHHEMGVSQRTILRKLGYDPDEEAAQRKLELEADPLTSRLIAPPGGDAPSPAGGTGASNLPPPPPAA